MEVLKLALAHLKQEEESAKVFAEQMANKRDEYRAAFERAHTRWSALHRLVRDMEELTQSGTVEEVPL